MDIGNIAFDPSVDVSEVDQFGFVDLNDAFRSGTVQGDLAPVEEDYNGIDKASDVGSKPRDNFEAVEMGKAALRAGQVKSDQPSDGK